VLIGLILAHHAERCSRSESPQATQRIQDCEAQFEDLKKENANLLHAFETVRQGYKKTVASKRKIIDTSYSYDRFHFVVLARLICQDLEFKPNGVNRNRIYNLVKNVCGDFSSRILGQSRPLSDRCEDAINVCHASAWFRPAQSESFQRWSEDGGFGW
jgi:hypothetical protein